MSLGATAVRHPLVTFSGHAEGMDGTRHRGRAVARRFLFVTAALPLAGLAGCSAASTTATTGSTTTSPAGPTTTVVPGVGARISLSDGDGTSDTFTVTLLKVLQPATLRGRLTPPRTQTGLSEFS